MSRDAVIRTLFMPALVVFFVAVPNAHAAAQRGQTSAINGIVRDATGVALEGVALTLTSERSIGGPVIVGTTADGSYKVLELLPGDYEIQVTHPGFKTVARTGIQLIAGGAVTLDWTLEVATAERLFRSTRQRRQSTCVRLRRRTV